MVHIVSSTQAFCLPMSDLLFAKLELEIRRDEFSRVYLPNILAYRSDNHKSTPNPVQASRSSLSDLSSLFDAIRSNSQDSLLPAKNVNCGLLMCIIIVCIILNNLQDNVELDDVSCAKTTAFSSFFHCRLGVAEAS